MSIDLVFCEPIITNNISIRIWDRLPLWCALSLFFSCLKVKVLQRLHIQIEFKHHLLLRSFFFFMVKSIYHRCCKSIIGYQYLSLTFLTCSNICFYFLSCIYQHWKMTHNILDFKKVKDEAVFLFPSLSGIKSLIRRWNKEIFFLFSC